LCNRESALSVECELAFKAFILKIELVELSELFGVFDD